MDTSVFDDPDIWTLIERFFTSQPMHPALTSTKLSLTYRELKENITKLKSILDSVLPKTYRDKTKKRSIALHLPNSVAYVVCVLTSVYMEQPFNPLPVDWPQSMKKDALEDVKDSVLITTKKELDQFPNGRVLSVVKCSEVLMEEDLYVLYLEEYEGNIDLDDKCCYVIYTSGSTGKPKGVQCVRSGVTNLAKGQILFWDLCPEDITGQFAPVAYDAIVSEVFTVYASGGTLAVLYPEQRLGYELVKTMNELKVSVITFVPSLLSVLEPDDFPLVRKLVTAGEACSTDIALKWYRPGVRRFFNAYGPAENTVCATMYEFKQGKLNSQEYKLKRGVPIGTGMRGVVVRLLDDNMQEVQVGVNGEIYIGGRSLSLGYVGHAARFNEESFVRNPTDATERLYKTGDLAVKDTQGDLLFICRVDNQVKIRGMKVIPEAVEEKIMEVCPEVQMAVVVTQQLNSTPRLAAFIAPASLDHKRLREVLAKSLSQPEIPSFYKLLNIDAFPRNSNDKIDRKQLETTYK